VMMRTWISSGPQRRSPLVTGNLLLYGVTPGLIGGLSDCGLLNFSRCPLGKRE
jgi:hypothetical protein